MLSPISPYVLKEMRLEAQEDTDDLKHKWGFTPGAEDTMNISHGRELSTDHMGAESLPYTCRLQMYALVDYRCMGPMTYQEEKS